jgi:hypothetical protein
MPATIGPGSTGDDVKRLQRVFACTLQWNSFGPITGVFDASLETTVVPSGIVDDDTWFIWLTPGTAQQLRLEEACGLLDRLFGG